MNLLLVEDALKAYKEGASASDAARLVFYAGLFRLQQARAADVAMYTPYEGLSPDEADAAYAAFEPLLAKAPVMIDRVQFFGMCAQVADYMAERAGLDDAAAEALRTFDWYTFTGKLNLRLAGSNPSEFVEACLEDFDSFGIDSGVSTSLVMTVVAFALRSFVQPASEVLLGAVSRELKEGSQHEHSVRCPVCGSPAAASCVATAGGNGGCEREQYCSVCGAVWSYERMRCGVCGTGDASVLSFSHAEGDPSHGLQHCDECGQCQHVVFEEDLEMPLSMEVENVVMARLFGSSALV